MPTTDILLIGYGRIILFIIFILYFHHFVQFTNFRVLFSDVSLITGLDNLQFHQESWRIFPLNNSCGIRNLWYKYARLKVALRPDAGLESWKLVRVQHCAATVTVPGQKSGTSLFPGIGLLEQEGF